MARRRFLLRVLRRINAYWSCERAAIAFAQNMRVSPSRY
jgi:hypothetical protein